MFYSSYLPSHPQCTPTHTFHVNFFFSAHFGSGTFQEFQFSIPTRNASEMVSFLPPPLTVPMFLCQSFSLFLQPSSISRLLIIFHQTSIALSIDCMSFAGSQIFTYLWLDNFPLQISYICAFNKMRGGNVFQYFTPLYFATKIAFFNLNISQPPTRHTHSLALLFVQCSDVVAIPGGERVKWAIFLW